MKYAFVQRHRCEWPISVQCRVLRISVTGYHEHFVRKANCWERQRLNLEYSRARLHSTLGYISLMQFEQVWLVNQPRHANS